MVRRTRGIVRECFFPSSPSGFKKVIHYKMEQNFKRKSITKNKRNRSQTKLKLRPSCLFYKSLVCLTSVAVTIMNMVKILCLLIRIVVRQHEKQL